MVRAYQSEQDLAYMRDLLVAGRAAANGTYYIHIGDLNWWMYRPPDEAQRRAGIRLWEADDGRLLGWAYAPPDDGTLDVYVHPAIHGTSQAEDMIDWAIDWSTAAAQQHAQDKLALYWIADDDVWLQQHFAKRGFAPADTSFVHFSRNLAEVSTVQLPVGYQIVSVSSETVGVQRAQATYRAFANTMPWADYWDRYRRFIECAAHIGERDLVVVSPDGFGVSACCIWFDEINQVGLFEPVGTHPDFQRKGLGKALLTEALHRMKAAGLLTAIVSTNDKNVSGIGLYQSIGFEMDMQFTDLVKRIGGDSR